MFPYCPTGNPYPFEGKSLGCSMIRPSSVMILSDESRSFIAAKILQWMDTMFIVLLPDLRGELNSRIIGVGYLSFANFISVACLIIRSRISMLYGLGLVRLLLTDVMECSSGDLRRRSSFRRHLAL